MPFDRQILVLAEDPAVRQTKQLLLEQLGFTVIAVSTHRELEFVASRTILDLAILGRTVEENAKRQAAATLRVKRPNTLILEICNVSPCIANPDFVLRSPNPEDLAAIVKMIFTKKADRIGEAAS